MALKEFLEREDGALLGVAFAEEYKDKYAYEPGQTYKLKELGDTSIYFAGVFKSTNPVYNTIILAGKTYLQQIDDKLGTANHVYVKIDSPENIKKVVTAIDSQVQLKFSYKTSTTDQRSFLTSAVEDLKGMIDLAHIIMVITLGVILLAVANTISMATRDRVQEIGILRSLGFRKPQIMTLVLGESMILSLIGGGLGLGITYAVMNSSNLIYGLRGVNIRILITPEVIVFAIAISFAVGILGGIFPAIGASRLNIVNSLRNVD